MRELLSKILVMIIAIYGFKMLMFGGKKSSYRHNRRGIGFFELVILGGLNMYVKLVKLLVFVVFFTIFLFWAMIYL